jgi:hypothetical protein
MSLWNFVRAPVRERLSYDQAKTYEVDGLPSAGGVIGDIKVQMQICVGADTRVI